MNDPLHQETASDDDLDEELVLYFLADYHALEGALVRAGFTRASHTPGDPRPDWERFSLYIASRFDPESEVEVEMAVGYLLADRDRNASRWKRLAESIPGEPSKPHSDIVWLAELVQEIRHRSLLWLNFMGDPGCDNTDVMAAMMVVEAWSKIDPNVKSMLAHVH